MDHDDEGRDWIRRHRRWEQRLTELHRIAGVPVPTIPRTDFFGQFRDLWQ
jgi:hypothetical protein